MRPDLGQELSYELGLRTVGQGHSPKTHRSPLFSEPHSATTLNTQLPTTQPGVSSLQSKTSMAQTPVAQTSPLEMIVSLFLSARTSPAHRESPPSLLEKAPLLPSGPIRRQCKEKGKQKSPRANSCSSQSSCYKRVF